jgi:hypothetical protein
MKKYVHLTAVICGILFCAYAANAQKQIEVVLPKTEFDFKLATDMLNTGKSKISGVAFYEERAGLIQRKIGDPVYARVGEVVSLYPITPYFAEFLELQKKDKKGKRMAAISREVNSFRILTKVYSLKGEFIFTGLAPGKYYLETTVYFPNGVGGPEVSGVVEIKTDGETASIILKKKYVSLFGN